MNPWRSGAASGAQSPTATSAPAPPQRAQEGALAAEKAIGGRPKAKWGAFSAPSQSKKERERADDRLVFECVASDENTVHPKTSFGGSSGHVGSMFLSWRRRGCDGRAEGEHVEIVSARAR